MLEEFIEAGELKAKILKKRVPFKLARCVVFLPADKTKKPVLAIVPAGKRISLEKLVKEAGYKKLREATEKEAFNITGYKKDFIPPISIYGVRVLIEESLMKRDFLHILIGEEATLKISPEEIISSSEGPVEVCKLLEEKGN